MKTLTVNGIVCSIEMKMDKYPKLIIPFDNSIVNECIYQCPIHMMNLYDDITEKRIELMLKEIMRYDIQTIYDRISYCLN